VIRNQSQMVQWWIYLYYAW